MSANGTVMPLGMSKAMRRRIAKTAAATGKTDTQVVLDILEEHESLKPAGRVAKPLTAEDAANFAEGLADIFDEFMAGEVGLKAVTIPRLRKLAADLRNGMPK